MRSDRPKDDINRASLNKQKQKVADLRRSLDKSNVQKNVPVKSPETKTKPTKIKVARVKTNTPSTSSTGGGSTQTSGTTFHGGTHHHYHGGPSYRSSSGSSSSSSSSAKATAKSTSMGSPKKQVVKSKPKDNKPSLGSLIRKDIDTRHKILAAPVKLTYKAGKAIAKTGLKTVGGVAKGLADIGHATRGQFDHGPRRIKKHR